MKQALEALDIAFSMYSRVPMPRVDWNEKNMKFVLCYFPLVGLVIGLCQGLGLWLLREQSSILRAAVAVALPVLLTGGIHMDGFCDTVDALSSHQSREKKLEILKDSNAGAFAVIFGSLYLLLAFALWESLLPRLEGPCAAVLLLGYGLSRSLSGFSIVSFPCAKNTGLVALFSQAADKKKARLVLGAWVLILAGAMLGLQLRAGLLCLGAALGIFAYYRWMSRKEFGGITGDLAGYFLQLCELAMPALLLIGG